MNSISFAILMLSWILYQKIPPIIQEGFFSNQESLQLEAERRIDERLKYFSLPMKYWSQDVHSQGVGSWLNLINFACLLSLLIYTTKYQNIKFSIKSSLDNLLGQVFAQIVGTVNGNIQSSISNKPHQIYSLNVNRASKLLFESDWGNHKHVAQIWYSNAPVTRAEFWDLLNKSLLLYKSW